MVKYFSEKRFSTPMHSSYAKNGNGQDLWISAQQPISI